MVVLYTLPKWFLGVGMALHLTFALITFLVAMYAYKVYKLSMEREFKFFSVSFGFISLAYIIEFVLNAFVVSDLQNGVEILLANRIQTVSFIGVYTHIFLFAAGLITLAYVTTKTKDLRSYGLLIFIGFLAIAFSSNRVLAFYILSLILIFFIFIYYFEAYRTKKSRKCFLVMLAFLLLFISAFNAIFSLQQYFTYVISNLFEFFAYVLILVSLLPKTKNEQKKK